SRRGRVPVRSNNSAWLHPRCGRLVLASGGSTPRREVRMADSTARQPRHRGPRWYLAVGMALGFALAGLLGLLVLGPITLTHHDAAPLETAYGNTVVGLVARILGAGLGPNP